MLEEINALQESVSQLQEQIDSISGIGASGLLTAGAAFVGAAIASIVHYIVAKKTIKAGVVAEARKVWIADVRRDLSELLAEVYMPYSADAQNYDVKKKVNAAISRIRLLLTPEKERGKEPEKDRDRHNELELKLEQLSTKAFSYLDGESEYEAVFDKAREVEDVARRIFYDTWKQIKEESHAKMRSPK